MNTTTQEPQFEGVLQGPFGSFVRNEFGVDNKNHARLFSEAGLRALREVLTRYRDSGATVGGAPTFAVSNQRLQEGQWDAAPEWGPYATWNRSAAQLAHHVYGKSQAIFGLLAPATDTSGGDDAGWQALGNRGAWAQARHRPQVETLRGAGIDSFLVEAGRYIDEAKALAALVAETGGKRLAFSFEAPGAQVPDPQYQLSFEQAKAEIIDAAHGRIEILVGMNCVGATAITRAIESGEHLDIAYPNQSDFGAIDDAGRAEYIALLHRPAGSLLTTEQARLTELQNRTLTTPEQFEQCWKVCLQARTKIIGVCCGGNPELTALARKTWNAHQNI